MNSAVYNALYQAVKNYAGSHVRTLETIGADTAKFNIMRVKYVITTCDVVCDLAPDSKITPTLSLWRKATANAEKLGFTPLICAVGSNGCGVISAIAETCEEFEQTHGDDLNHIAVSKDGLLSVIAFNRGGQGNE